MAGEALGVSRKVGSEEWGESQPPTCDWRNKPNTISPVRNQVSASTPSPAAWPNPAPGRGWCGEAGRRGPAVFTHPHRRHPFTIRETATVAGPWQQQATSRPCGPSAPNPLWRSPCSVWLGAGVGTGGQRRRGLPEAWAHTLSLLAPELLDCDRCGNGCHGGFVWDAFLTVLNNSECLAALGSHGGGRMGWVLFPS